ncbi:MAG TPA: beta-N-acetylhexosaminidase [Rhodanobacteraceae bacterium]|nr:beta-N-acetylhexosaminidase [Rhodanobacteraceae bacterium]
MLIVGFAATSLSEEERSWIESPAISGAILFARNIVDRTQLARLVADIRRRRGDDFLLCIDQEGGLVQRLRGGEFTTLPPLARIGECYDRDPKWALELAERHAWLMASEVRACDIDLSFAPVADLARGSRVIGTRALHADPEIAAELVQAYVRGMHLAGMAATLKHFPGHGSVAEDTHLEDATDARSLEAIRTADLVPFAAAIEAGAEAVMMAHVRYPAVDPRPAGYASRWIGEVLRTELGFGGVVFSDDVAMRAAESAGGLRERILGHLDAGCDLILVCQAGWAGAAIEAVRGRSPLAADRLAPLLGNVAPSWEAMQDNPKHTEAVASVSTLDPAGKQA